MSKKRKNQIKKGERVKTEGHKNLPDPLFTHVIYDLGIRATMTPTYTERKRKAENKAFKKIKAEYCG